MGKERKKHKKKNCNRKKHKSSKHHSSSDSSSSSVEEWVEMNPVLSTSGPQCRKPQEEPQPEKRIDNEQDWLMNSDIFNSISRDEIRQKRENKKDKKEDDKYMLDKLGQTDRELNPYWKDGGSGLPQETPVAPESLRQATVTVGDQGVTWLRKALQRAKEQAQEQGRPLEQVVAERWGSLEKLESMIAEAEKREINTPRSNYQNKSKYRDEVKKPKDKSNERSRKENSENDLRYEQKNGVNNEEAKEKSFHHHEKGNSSKDYKYKFNSKNQNISFKKPNHSDSDSSGSKTKYNKHSKSSDEHKNNRFIKPGDSSSEEETRSNSKYRSKHKKKDKISSKKNSSRRHRSSSSSCSDIDEDSAKSDESSGEEDKRHKYDQRHSKRDQISKKKYSKKGYKSSSSDDDDQHSSKRNRNNYNKKEELYEGKKNVSKRAFIKPHHDSDDDSFRHNDERQSEKMKLYSSSSRKGWRKKAESPKKEDNIKDCSMIEESTTKKSAKSVQEEVKTPAVERPQVLTDKEMNDLGAKLVKAELLGNQELAKEFKEKLERAREAKANAPKEDETSEQVVILTHTDSKGFTRPVSLSGSMEPTTGRRKAKKVDTHAGGKRMRYFADDDKYSLQEMFQREKLSTVEDSNAVFAKLASKGVGRDDSARDMDDVFEETARMEEADGRKNARERQQAIEQSKRTARSLDNCQWCLESKQMLKHLIVAMGQTCYLCVPPFQSITEHHCLLVPSHHTPCATQLDEDVWREMQDFRKSVVQMFLSQDQVVFFESARYLNKFPHMVINCVPMPKETGDLAPIYFKKAIQECEMEWSNNKKLVELKGRDVRRAVPRGLPYFAVDFGMENGFAHVIEDEKLFPQNFAQEIIGGMLDLDHTIWRKQRRQTFEEQSKKVIQLNKLWSPFDTKNKNV